MDPLGRGPYKPPFVPIAIRPASPAAQPPGNSADMFGICVCVCVYSNAQISKQFFIRQSQIK